MISIMNTNSVFLLRMSQFVIVTSSVLPGDDTTVQRQKLALWHRHLGHVEPGSLDIMSGHYLPDHLLKSPRRERLVSPGTTHFKKEDQIEAFEARFQSKHGSPHLMQGTGSFASLLASRNWFRPNSQSHAKPHNNKTY